MEAGTTPRPYVRPGAPYERPQGSLETLAHGFADPIRNVLIEAGELAAFGFRGIVEIRGVWRYTAELLRQAGILITGSMLVLIGMQFVFGLTCGNEAVYVFRAYGASSYEGVFTALCPLREATPFMFAYMVGAKIGCGYVAELGSMRINEEIDAMESLGINPVRYLVSTRFVANLLVSFPIFLIGLCTFFLGEMFVILFQVKDISFAQWSSVNWEFIDLGTILESYTKTTVMWLAIVMTSMYYGFRARGGPVGVGNATARSMIAALAMTMILNEGFTFFFWGVNPRLPVGG